MIVLIEQVKYANIIFANIKQVNNSILIKFYKIFARPLLEYASVFCCPHHINLVDRIKSVQLRFTKRLPSLHDINYNDRLYIVILNFWNCIEFILI